MIVGGTSGIGLATARRLHGLGAEVHIAGRSQDRIASSDPDLTGTVIEADGGMRLVPLG